MRTNKTTNRMTDEPRSETEQETKRTDAREDESVCEECGGSIRKNEQQGEMVCEDCGLVADEKAIDRGPEWRAFNHGEKSDKSRVGAPTTKMMHDDGLSTNIGWQNKDSNGNPLSNRQRAKMNRLRTWNERFRTRDSKERNLKQALSEISRMGSALGLNNQVQETASVIYRQCLDKDLLPGRSIEGVATASLYAAARQCNTPRSLSEVYPVSRISEEREIDRTYRYIAKELGLEMEPVDPRQYLNRFINELDVEDEELLRQQAEDILDAAEADNLHSGKAPTGLAAAAIYAGNLITKDGLTQRKISDVADTTQVTIRNRYQEMLESYMGEEAIV